MVRLQLVPEPSQKATVVMATHKLSSCHVSDTMKLTWTEAGQLACIGAVRKRCFRIFYVDLV